MIVTPLGDWTLPNPLLTAGLSWLLTKQGSIPWHQRAFLLRPAEHGHCRRRRCHPDLEVFSRGLADAFNQLQTDTPEP